MSLANTWQALQAAEVISYRESYKRRGDYFGYFEVVSIDLVDAITERFHARELGFSARLTQIQDNSYTIEWDGPQVDLLFVDGCHTYDCVKKDIAAWLPRMKPDGVVCFHDYGIDDGMWLDVKRAVDEDMIGQEQIYQVGCSIAFSLGAKK